MTARDHSALAVIGGILIFVLTSLSCVLVRQGWMIAALSGMLLLWLSFVYLVRVRCDKPGCNGRMHLAFEFHDIALWLAYDCQVCFSTYARQLISLESDWRP